MTSGIIRLYDYNWNYIRHRVYLSKPQRKKIIEDWRKYYQDRFNDCIITFEPRVKIDRVLEDGKNDKVRRKWSALDRTIRVNLVSRERWRKYYLKRKDSTILHENSSLVQ